MKYKRRIKAVIFDLDDTLIDWSGQTQPYREVVRPHLDNMYHHLAAAGCALPDQDSFAHCWRETVSEQWEGAKGNWAGISFRGALAACLETLGIETEGLDLEAAMRAYEARPIPGVVLFADTLSVLEQLREQGYLLGLITNSMMPMWMRDAELLEYQLLDYFNARITSGDIGYMKPHPAIYDHMLELLGIAAHEAVFVGDRPANDIAGANEVGMTSVLITPPHLSFELNGVQPDYIIKQLSDLLPILEGLVA
jgi:putative hydrolase of the HAD superfamily